VAFNGAPGATAGSITLQWANNALNKNNVAGLKLTVSPGGPTGGVTFKPTTTGATVTGLTSNTAYTFTLQAVSNVTGGSSAAVTVFSPTPTTTAAATVTAP
jgi:hypothetical protein